jgi:glycogen operon protein
MNQLTLWPGKPYPLGAQWDGKGTNFALFSENATRVELCLYENRAAREPYFRAELREQTAHVWHGYALGVKPGRLYAYRVDGPFDPGKGQRFNPSKLLVDPYAKAIAGTFPGNDELFGYTLGDQAQDLSRDERDSGPYVPKCVIVDPTFDWEGDKPLRIPWNETVLYEIHLKGFTLRHPEVEATKRGTYLGLASPKVVGYLKDLGITAVELMPLHQHVDERRLTEHGLTNYWGYNTIGFFAPDSRYSSSGVCGEQVWEFKEMVKALHAAGIEIILDVVYNHTAEGNQLGPTFCFRGIDNASYYRLSAENPRYYMDFTGCGNSLNMTHPSVIQLIMDSLRYWAIEMHVDGFRFDLAAALARELFEVDKLSCFFDVIQQDPALSNVKLIAEPWDLGPSGYQVGNFPPRWAEWNGKYRDRIRSFWRGDESQISDLAYRMSGSSDLYAWDRRKPSASINFVACHDGFTLQDLVSYDTKHNEANKSDNKDGTDNNVSWNCGREGPSRKPEVVELRERQKRNFLATLLLSQGVPMLLGGDERGRTQRGNNNAYCQDNEISWVDWKLDERKSALLEFTRALLQFRRAHPIFRRKKYFQGKKLFGSSVKDLTWLKPDGGEMTEQAWKESFVRTIGVLMAGDAIDDADLHGERITDDTFVLLLNAHHDTVPFLMPGRECGWEHVLHTRPVESDPAEKIVGSGEKFNLEGRSLVLFRRV